MGTIFQKPPNNYQYLVGIENLVDYQTGSVSVSGPIAPGNLHLLNAPANVLVQDGQSFKFHCRGSMAGTAGTKTLSLVVPGVGTVNLAIFAAAEQGSFTSEFRITRGLFEGGETIQLAGVTVLGVNNTANFVRLNRFNLIGYVVNTAKAFQFTVTLSAADTTLMDFSSLTVL